MPAHIGNQHGLALPTPELRAEAFKAFCEWLAKGKSPFSFTFEKDNYGCCGRTIISYLEKFSQELSAIKRDIAFAKGYAHWEDVVDNNAKGIDKNSNLPGLQMVMRNKYKWDAKEDDKKSDTSEAIEKMSKFFSSVQLKSDDTPPIQSETS